jgi:hypothetical protein
MMMMMMIMMIINYIAQMYFFQVSILLRVASLADLVFLVNHVMRCPPGFASRVASFIQFPVPRYHGDTFTVAEQYFWDNPLVHHFVAMLAAILQPVR